MDVLPERGLVVEAQRLDIAEEQIKKWKHT